MIPQNLRSITSGEINSHLNNCPSAAANNHSHQAISAVNPSPNSQIVSTVAQPQIVQNQPPLGLDLSQAEIEPIEKEEKKQIDQEGAQSSEKLQPEKGKIPTAPIQKAQQKMATTLTNGLLPVSSNPLNPAHTELQKKAKSELNLSSSKKQSDLLYGTIGEILLIYVSEKSKSMISIFSGLKLFELTAVIFRDMSFHFLESGDNRIFTDKLFYHKLMLPVQELRELSKASLIEALRTWLVKPSKNCIKPQQKSTTKHL